MNSHTATGFQVTLFYPGFQVVHKPTHRIFMWVTIKATPLAPSLTDHTKFAHCISVPGHGNALTPEFCDLKIMWVTEMAWESKLLVIELESLRSIPRTHVEEETDFFHMCSVDTRVCEPMRV